MIVGIGIGSGIVVLLTVKVIRMESVSSDKFEDYFYQEIGNRGFTMDERRTIGRGPYKLPVLLKIRFPRTSHGGNLGFPDATSVYTFKNASGLFVCRAHHRSYEVCYIELNPEHEVDGLASAIMDKFPGLSIARTSPP